MNDIVIDLEQTLFKHGVLGVQYKNWNSILVDHSSNVYNETHLREFRSLIGKKRGIYVYTFNDGSSEHILYVGKSQDLASRLSVHYKERHDKMGMPKWRQFWQSHTHQMKIYYKEINVDADSYVDEAMRIIVERYMIAKLKPISENTYKSVK